MDEDINRLLVVYDNNSFDRNLRSAWGFSCLILANKHHILFDTGGDPSILLKNMNQMGIDPEKIDTIVLSHNHGDHTGGLSGILERNNHAIIYMPKSFSGGFKNAFSAMGTRYREVGDPMMIYQGIHTSGELGRGIREQSLIMETLGGLVIITGCAHPGIVEIVEQSKRLFSGDVQLLLGGFHLMGYSPGEIRTIIKRLDELGVKRISPCHCSGDTARDLFRQHYGDNYIECGAGLEVEIPEIKK